MDARLRLVAENKNKPGVSAADVGRYSGRHLRSDRLAVLRRGFGGREHRQRGNNKCEAKRQKAGA
jgi:hypothetical protein